MIFSDQYGRLRQDSVCFCVHITKKEKEGFSLFLLTFQTDSSYL
jgi:hypothetical protein